MTELSRLSDHSFSKQGAELGPRSSQFRLGVELRPAHFFFFYRRRHRKEDKLVFIQNQEPLDDPLLILSRVVTHNLENTDVLKTQRRLVEQFSRR